MGSPVAIRIGNTEWPKWQAVMAPDPVSDEALAAADDVNAEQEIARNRPLTRPRPGHADLVGMQKYGFDDARPVLERASARETAARVALGEVAAQFLRQAYGIELVSHTVAIGGAGGPRGRAPADPRAGGAARRRPGARPRRRGVRGDGRRGRGGQEGRRHPRRGRGGARLRAAARAGLPRPLGPAPRRAARRRPHGHPGDQGGRGRRRLPHRRPTGVGRPRRDGARRPTAPSAGAPDEPAAPRAGCPPATCCGSGPR